MNTAFLLDAFRKSIQPRDTRPSAEWGAEHVTLSRSTDAAKFRPEFTPYWSEVLDEIRSNQNQVVSILAPTGAGKSTLLEVAACDILSRDPGPMMIAAQTDDDVKEWAETGLYPAMRACEPLRGRLPTARGKWRTDCCLMEGAELHLTGANVSGTQSKSKRWVFLDEAWLAREGRIADLKARLHKRWNGRLVLMGQAGFLEADEDGNVIGDDWTLIHSQGEQRQWGFACDRCGLWQPFDFDALEYPEEGTIAERAQSASLACQNTECNQSWSDTIDARRALSKVSSWKKTRDGVLPRQVSFHMDAIGVWRNDWAEEIIEHLDAEESHKRGRTTPKQQIQQKRRARPWSRAEAIEAGDIDYHNSRVCDYTNGERIDSEFHRFLIVDTQQDHFWAAVRAFRHDGSSLALGFWQVTTESGIEDLRRKYEVREVHTYVDASYDSPRVYGMCARNGYTALKGDKVEGYTHTVMDRKTRKKTKVKREISELQQVQSKAGRCRFIRLATNPLKDVLARLRSGQGVRWQAVSDIDPRWAKFLDSEVREEDGWRQVKRDNHSWDLEYYAVAAAIIWGALK